MFDLNSKESNESVHDTRSRGGARPGAGRKKGEVSKARLAVQERAKLAATEGTTPLEYMLNILRDPTTDQKRKDAMAIAAAPYVHARLAATELSGKVEMSHEQRLEALK